MFEKKQFTLYALASLMAFGIMSGCATQPEIAESKPAETQKAAVEKELAKLK